MPKNHKVYFDFTIGNKAGIIYYFIKINIFIKQQNKQNKQNKQQYLKMKNQQQNKQNKQYQGLSEYQFLFLHNNIYLYSIY